VEKKGRKQYLYPHNSGIMIDQKENSAHLISDQSCHNSIRRFLLVLPKTNIVATYTSSFRAKFGPIPGNIASKVRKLFTST
jgi:hypothetical protein